MEVVEVPSVTVLTGLMAAQHRPLRRAVLVACDPQQRLVHHVDEVRYIFSKLGLDDLVLLTDQPRAITRDALISELQRADIFHFAGHGSFIPEKPDQSGLLLSDGLFSLSMLEKTFENHAPSLVYLSACDTGRAEVGKLGETPTLLTAFLQIGAKAAIGSLWPVPDSIATETAHQFYNQLQTSGPIKALNSARQVLWRQSPRHEDGYWASFKILGWD